MEPLLNVQILRFPFLALLFSTLILSSAATLGLSLACAAVSLLILRHFISTRHRPVYLLNYSCYKPPPNQKCSLAAAESFLRRQAHITQDSIEFMRNIYHKSGLGEETYAPPFIFQEDGAPTLKCAVQEARDGIISAIDALLSKTLIDPSNIDVVIVACGSFSTSPSLSSLIVHRYSLKSDVKTYNLSGMGCSSGVVSVDFAARVLASAGKVQNALVVVTESIALNWYSGDSRPMLVSNCIFRVGCAAAIVTNDPCRHPVAKMKLVDWLRTHHGADDSSYRAAFQEEDDRGIRGISLTKDLVRVAGFNLRQHIKILALRVLPLSQLARYAYSVAASAIGGSKPAVPDFTTAFQHMCIHTGGKAVIENVARVLKLGHEVTEPARMSLNRFGNTSNSLVFYELAYFEAKRRVKRGDRMWILAFGTGFKVGSLVVEWLQDSTRDHDNPWNDCVHHYPLNVW